MQEIKNTNIISIKKYQKEPRIEIARSFQALRPHIEAWNRLALAAPQKIPTLSHAWVASYLEYFLAPGQKWRCFLAFEGNELVGLLPVIISPYRVLGLNRERFSTPHNNHSFSVDFLAARGRENVVIPYLLNALIESEPRLFDFSLNRLPEQSPTIAALNDLSAEMSIFKEYDGEGSYLKIEGTYEDFKNRLSYNFSRNLTKAHNKLAKLPDVKTVFLTGSNATEEELARFMRVEVSGWKGRLGSAIESSPILVSYYTAMARRLSELGWLEWHFLETAGHPIAAQMAVKMNRTLILLKIGYDEEFSYCAPGNILFERTVERAYLDNDTDEINCITDMPWHNNWAMQKRPHYNIWIYPHRPISLILGAVARGAKLRMKQLPGLLGILNKLRHSSTGVRNNRDKKD